LDGPRLGLRWKPMARGKVTRDLLADVVRHETDAPADGLVSESHLSDACALASAHVTPTPPGRDVFVGWSTESDRLIELVYHARERDDVLTHQLVPSLRDTAELPMQPWSVLDLACTVPAGFELRSHDLRAGDLQVHWTQGRRFLSVRQLAMAQVVLGRTSLERLIADRQRQQPHYHPAGSIAQEVVAMHDGREIAARVGIARRPRRFFWNAGLAPQRVTLALHDSARDRIVIVEADDLALVRQVAGAVGGGAA